MPSIVWEIKEKVACITLNRPEKLNAFNREMALELQSRLQQCALSAEIRCICLTGNGKAFSAGQDLEEVVNPAGPGMERILREHYNPIISAIRQLNKPVLAAVNGVAAGAGANIALCCDVVLAADTASFIQAFSRIGLVPDSGGTYYLPRLIGWQKASALAMLGDKISATAAEKMGMVYQVIPAAEFAAVAFTTARQLAQLPTRALGFIKQALNASFSNNLETQLQLEDVLQQQAAQTADYREGVQAFLEKRTPVFTGV